MLPTLNAAAAAAAAAAVAAAAAAAAIACVLQGSYVPLAVKNYGCGVLDVPYWTIALGSLIFGPLYGFQNFLLGAETARLGQSAEALSAGGGSGAAAAAAAGSGEAELKLVGGYVLQVVIVYLVISKVMGRVKRLTQ